MYKVLLFGNKIFIALFFLLTFPLFSDPYYKSYCNSRFQFCMDYPSFFVPQGESQNGDGQVFLSPDKEAEIRIYGNLAVDGVNETLEKEYKIAQSSLKITYKFKKKDQFVISGLDSDGKIVYRKTVKNRIQDPDSKNVDSYKTIILSYPKSQDNEYNFYYKVIKSKFN